MDSTNPLKRPCINLYEDEEDFPTSSKKTNFSNDTIPLNSFIGKEQNTAETNRMIKNRTNPGSQLDCLF